MTRDAALTILLATASLAALPAHAAPEAESYSAAAGWSVSSPDNQLRILIGTSGADLGYKVERAGKTIIEWSRLGLAGDGLHFKPALSPVQSRFTEDYELVSGKRRKISATFNRLVLTPIDPQGVGFELVASNAGFGFRYLLPQGKKAIISGEGTTIDLPDHSTVWSQVYPEANQYRPSYEDYFERMTYPFIRDSQFGWSFPLLAKVGDTYLLASEAIGPDATSPGYHLSFDYRISQYKFAQPQPAEAAGLGDTVQTLPEGGATSWRTFAVGSLGTILSSNLVTDLAPDLSPVFNKTIPDWAKPGKAAWDWWNRRRTGTPDEQKAYIDAAAEFGWDYVLIDAQWNRWNQDNAEPIVRDLVAYANARKIGLFLWYNSGGAHNPVMEGPRDRMHDRTVRQAEFARLSEWGIKGVKVDFWGSEKQILMQQYRALLEDAAKARILVNFHGSTIPRGWERQFPNLMTSEAVRGAEDYPYSSKVRPRHSPTAYDHLLYTLTRNVIGPMDYTPGIYEVPFKTYGITYGHQTALAVMFQSGVQHFADIADNPNAGYRKLFSAYPALAEFYRDVPAGWDDVRFVEGSPDSHLVLARRNGKHWFVGGINALHSRRKVTLNLDFAGSSSCKVLLIADGAQGNALQITRTTIRALKAGSVEMAPHGGFAAQVFGPCPKIAK